MKNYWIGSSGQATKEIIKVVYCNRTLAACMLVCERVLSVLRAFEARQLINQMVGATAMAAVSAEAQKYVLLFSRVRFYLPDIFRVFVIFVLPSSTRFPPI